MAAYNNIFPALQVKNMSPFIVSKGENLTSGAETEPGIFPPAVSAVFIKAQPSEPARLAQVA